MWNLQQYILYNQKRDLSAISYQCVFLQLVAEESFVFRAKLKKELRSDASNLQRLCMVVFFGRNREIIWSQIRNWQQLCFPPAGSRSKCCIRQWRFHPLPNLRHLPIWWWWRWWWQRWWRWWWRWWWWWIGSILNSNKSTLPPLHPFIRKDMKN